MEKLKIDKISECRKLNFDDDRTKINASNDGTGAIQKKRSSLKTLKPSNSLKHSDNGKFSAPITMENF